MINTHTQMKQYNKQNGSTLAGIMIGIILAMLAIGGMLWWVNTQKSPFKPQLAKEKKSTTTTPKKQAVVVKDHLGELIDKMEETPPLTVSTEGNKAKDILEGSAKNSVIIEEAIPQFEAITPPVPKMLQIGSFSDITQAKAQQARLLMLNVKTRIESAVVKEKTVYRVYSGSLNEIQAKQLQQALQEQGIDSLLITPR